MQYAHWLSRLGVVLLAGVLAALLAAAEPVAFGQGSATATPQPALRTTPGRPSATATTAGGPSGNRGARCRRPRVEPAESP